MTMLTAIATALPPDDLLARGRNITPDRVAYGALDMPRSAQAAFDAAVAYLSRDSVERGLFDGLKTATRSYHLAVNAHNDDSYDPTTHTIHWDPTSALRTSGGATQSPALGLGHEVDHALFDERQAARLAATYDQQYNNKEERRVIVGSERHAALTLGEGVRYDHGGHTYRVAAPILR